MKNTQVYFLFVLVCILFVQCGNETATKQEVVSVKPEPADPFLKLPLCFSSNDQAKSFTLTLDTMVKNKINGNWFRLAGQTDGGQDAREDEDITIAYDTANSTLSFVSPFSEDSTRIVFTCIKKQNGIRLLVSKNFQYADTLVECIKN